MTSAIAPVSFDANKFISKQSNTPSVNDAGNSFNQILAKQVDAKRANRSEQSNQRTGDKVTTPKPSDKVNTETKSENATEAASATKDQDETIDETFSNAASPIIALVEGINRPQEAIDTGSEEGSLVKSDETSLAVEAQLAGALASSANSIRELVKSESNGDTNNRNALPSGASLDLSAQPNESIEANAIKVSISASEASAKITESNDTTSAGFLNALEKASQNSAASEHNKLETDAKADAKSDALANTAQLKEKSLLGSVQSKLSSEHELKDAPQASNDAASIEPTFSHFQTIAQQAVSHANPAIAQAEHLAPTVGTRAWDQALGQKVIWLVAGGEQSAELTLNPPDLGPLQVILKVNDDQLTADFSANQAAVRDALESALPKLRQILNDAGIQLSGFSVNSQAPQQQNQFLQHQSPQSFGRSASAESNNALGAVSNTDQTKVLAKVGLVDTFA